MPSTSKAQQKAMCMAYAARKGKLNKSELKGAALDIYNSDMTDKQIKDFMVLKESTNISLKESILKSVKAGKYALVDDWCKNNITNENGYVINNDLTISDKNGAGIFIKNDCKDIPSYIKFDRVEGYFTIGPCINTLTKEQSPKSVGYLTLFSNVEELNIDNITTNYGMNILSIPNALNTLKKVKKFNITITDLYTPFSVTSELDFTQSKLRYNDLKNININAKNISISLFGTPAGKKLSELYLKNKDNEKPIDFLKRECPNFVDVIKFLIIDKYTFRKANDDFMVTKNR